MAAGPGAACAVVVDPPNEERLNTKDACQFLGISRATLIRLMNKGELRYYQIAGRNQFPVADLRAYLESCEVQG
jgi:excisionase family DNA binding protein